MIDLGHLHADLGTGTDDDTVIAPWRFLSQDHRPREVRDPRDAAWLLLTCPDLEVRYAPGDMTLYRVSLISSRPYGRVPGADLHVGFMLMRTDAKHLIINRPSAALYDPVTWLDCGHPAGWWSAARPVLAGIGWATGPPVLDRTTDVGDMTELLSR